MAADFKTGILGVWGESKGVAKGVYASCQIYEDGLLLLYSFLFALVYVTTVASSCIIVNEVKRERKKERVRLNEFLGQSNVFLPPRALVIDGKTHH
jgi:hypothetical protein